MSKYNSTKKSPTSTPVTNHQGGIGYQLEPKLELISLLATGIENKYYEKEGERETRLKSLIDSISKTDPTFVAKAMIYARTVMGQRSVTHLGAVALAPHLSGTDLGKRFFSKRDRKAEKGGIIFRLDDMIEITACYMAKNPGKPLSNAVKKGFKDALEAADEYELAKYQAKTRDISLVDIVNLVHPRPSERMKKTFEKLMKGELKQFNTVEDKNTNAGKKVAEKVKAGTITKAQAEVELREAKEDNYAQLIRERKIGYLALLRNLRNILNNTSDKTLIKDACLLLTDEKLIKQSLVFPHQIDLALEIMLTEFSASQMKEMAAALDKAYELAIPNLTELFTHGKTAVVFDSSASMGSGRISTGDAKSRKNFQKTAKEKAALIGATLAKGIGADLYHFASSCEKIRFNPNDSVNTIKNTGMMQEGRVGHGTDFQSIFRTLGNTYDRVFIISDLQGHDYVNRVQHKDMHIYCVDICGYGTTMFKPGSKVYGIYGYSSDIYELIKKVEIDPKALLKEIEAIVI